MSSSYEEQREEIERILKEIYNKMKKNNVLGKIWDSTLYYKEKGKELSYSPDYHEMLDIIYSKQLEYALYVGRYDKINPSEKCIRRYEESSGVGVLDALEQFISIFYISDEVLKGLGLGYTDPLDQILTYRRILTGNFPKHVYYCYKVYELIPYGPDPTSIFPGKRGIVAYCMSLEDLIRIIIITGRNIKNIDKISENFHDILENASAEILLNLDIYSLWKQDRVEACKLSRIVEAAQKEIEEANELMKKYRIIRVAFPLD